MCTSCASFGNTALKQLVRDSGGAALPRHSSAGLGALLPSLGAAFARAPVVVGGLLVLILLLCVGPALRPRPRPVASAKTLT